MTKWMTFCSAVLFGFSLAAQTSFYKQFSNNGYDIAQGVVQAADSSFYICGTSSSFVPGPSQMFIMKLDSLGNFNWSKHYGGNESDFARRIVAVGDSGFYLVGYSNSFTPDYNVFVVRLDHLGNYKWEKHFGTAAWDRVWDATLTADSGLVIVGETYDTEDGEMNAYAVRMDKNGYKLWERNVGQDNRDVFQSVIQVTDTTYLLAGSVYAEDQARQMAYYELVHIDGTLIANDSLGADGNYEFLDVMLHNAKFHFNGWRIQVDGDTTNYAVTLNSDFSMNNTVEYDTDGLGYNYAKVPFGNGSYIKALAFQNDFSYGMEDLAFFEVYPDDWDLASRAAINYVDMDVLGELIPTVDKGALGVGYIDNTAVGGANIFVIKIHPSSAFFNSNDDFTYESLLTVIHVEENPVRFYPNPVNEHLFIESKIPVRELTLFDLSGKKLLVAQGTSTIDFQAMNAGVYLVKVELENDSVSVQRIIKK